MSVSVHPFNLRIFMLRVSESEFLGGSLWTWERLESKSLPESKPLKSRFLLCDLTVLLWPGPGPCRFLFGRVKFVIARGLPRELHP